MSRPSSEPLIYRRGEPALRVLQEKHNFDLPAATVRTTTRSRRGDPLLYTLTDLLTRNKKEKRLEIHTLHTVSSLPSLHSYLKKRNKQRKESNRFNGFWGPRAPSRSIRTVIIPEDGRSGLCPLSFTSWS